MRNNSCVSYYGGKSNLVPELLKLIPKHDQYIEPFCGGASLYWSKKPSRYESLNDSNMQVINFWECLQSSHDFPILQTLIQNSLHSEYYYKKAAQILKEPIVNRAEYAWSFFIQCNLSFSNKIFGGFAFNITGDLPKYFINKCENFTDKFHKRIKHTEIFCRDAINLIKLKDNKDVFMYFDPPYAESDCGSYESTKGVYYELLDLLPTLQCNWLMSSYPSEQLTELRLKHGWYSKDIIQNLSVNSKQNKGKKKTECLTWNYELLKHELF